MKSLKYPREFFRLDAPSGITANQITIVGIVLHFQSYFSALGSKFHTVGEDIEDDFLEKVVIDPDATGSIGTVDNEADLFLHKKH